MDMDGYWLDCDYISGACFSFENGMKHFKYGDIAAVGSDYGFAVSHLVLGVEELIKSLLLVCLHSNQYFLTTKEKEKIFSQHNFKHLNIKELFSSLLPERIEAYHENPFAFINSEQANKFQTTAHFLSRGLKLGTIEEDEINILLKLMSHANDHKNKGFYVDYRFDWKLPEDIDSNLYAEYKKLTNKLIGLIEPLFTMPITDERLQDFLEGEWI